VRLRRCTPINAFQVRVSIQYWQQHLVICVGAAPSVPVRPSHTRFIHSQLNSPRVATPAVARGELNKDGMVGDETILSPCATRATTHAYRGQNKGSCRQAASEGLNKHLGGKGEVSHLRLSRGEPRHVRRGVIRDGWTCNEADQEGSLRRQP
jgi:hypothetical protein